MNLYAIVWVRGGALYTNSNPDGSTAAYSLSDALRDADTAVDSVSEVWDLSTSGRIAVPIDALNEFLGV